MKHIWAPWRINYILKKKTKGCFLCFPVGKKGNRDAFILAESTHSLVILNRYPYSAGHVMVVPKKHVPDFEGLDTSEITDLFLLVRTAVRAVKKALRPDGLNVGANLGKTAGAGAQDHLHIHLVPRWNGDHNFMPVLDSTMVISEYLEATYKRLIPYFKKYVT